MWNWLPADAIHHNPNAYLNAELQQALVPLNAGIQGSSLKLAMAVPAA
jgi:hypothetical protein